MDKTFEATVTMFMARLSVGRATAEALVNAGFSSLEEIAYVPVAELLETHGIPQGELEGLRTRAREQVIYGSGRP